MGIHHAPAGSEHSSGDEEGEIETGGAADGLPLDAVQSSVPERYSVYSLWEKRWIVLAVSAAAFFSPVTAQIYLPALNLIAADFRITATQVNLTMTTYMILQGVTPMFVGGLADGAGRRPAYMVCFIVYILANVGLAVCKNYASLLVVRCIQSAGSSSTIALCQAVVADIVTSAERGQYIGFTVLPTVLAPTVGPILGGVLSQYLGWRSIFWFLVISSAVMFVVLLLFLPETCRNIVGDGSIRPHPMYRTFWQLFQDWNQKRAQHQRHKKQRKELEGTNTNSNKNNNEMGDSGLLHSTSLALTATRASSVRPPLRVKFPNPLRSLLMLFEKQIGLLVGYNAIIFAGFYSISVAMPSQYALIYGYNDLVIGLMYIPMAAGSALTAFVMGPLMNYNYRRHARRLGLPVDKSRQADLADFPIERARLEVGIPLAVLATVVILCWGWVLEKRVSVAIPCVLNFFYGMGMIGFNNATSVLLIDVSPGHAGAAVAANNLARCLLGALFSAVIVPMINKLGIGWAFVLLGLLYAAFLPLMFLLMRNGIRYRREKKAKDDRRQQCKAEKREAKEREEKRVAAIVQGENAV
ncbi:hypothetical protein HMPREF1624_02438 [Sporothrix schenckii ATCC 58251]|uniref:Major facilitator superfamily (MFS) profile domain-containing protein n=1 Tax=Sporothrix schenckii (strain ATCC 58251 / de Perez 2211183) TaxID=1391915 RepID=U7Q3A4_SPOS1|nr:hypothetical protein HMPREF1624_02438 [Sporothrix schenckii ATCC 58251]